MKKVTFEKRNKDVNDVKDSHNLRQHFQKVNFQI
jgi:hypothetical protein